MNKYIVKPSIDLQDGIVVTKDTNIEFENEMVKQEIKGLELHSVMTIKDENYVSTYDTTIKLNEGDVLLFEEDSRGYIKPVEEFMSVEDAIKELEYIKE